MRVGDFEEAEEILIDKNACNKCEDDVEYCHECDRSIEDDVMFFCNGYGEHLCEKCFSKLKKQIKEQKEQ